MTQTTSFKNKLKSAFSLFKWELKSCSGTLAVYAILSATLTAIILTLTVLTDAFSSNNDGFLYLSIRTTPTLAFQNAALRLVFVLTIIFTVIFTIKIFSYLHNKRKADMYGSMPIGRIAMYFTRCATAFVFAVVPSLFFMGIITLISICIGQPIMDYNAVIYVQVVLGSLASISAFGVLAICCGTTINAVMTFIVTCIAYPLSIKFIVNIIKSFFLGFYNDFFEDSFFCNALNPIAAYQGKDILYWLVFSAICLAAGAFLVKRRKFERAQSSFAIYLPCHIVKILISFLVGVFLGTLFGSLDVLNGYFGFVFGFILGSVPAFIISHLIFYKGFDKLLKTSISLGVLIVAVAGLMAICNYDPFGYCSFTPDLDNIKSAGFIDHSQIYSKDNKSVNAMATDAAKDFEDKESVAAIVEANNIVIKNLPTEADEKYQSVWVNLLCSFLPSELNVPNYTFSYKTNSGVTVKKTYLDATILWQGNGTSDIDEAITEITSSKTYIEKYSALYNVSTSDFDDLTLNLCGEGEFDDEINFSYYCVNKTIKSGTENADKDREKIIEAFKKDFEADTSNDFLNYRIKERTYSGYNDTYDLYNDCIGFINISPSTDSNHPISNTEGYVIPKSYVNTAKALQELGILDKNNTPLNISPYHENDSYDLYNEAYSRAYDNNSANIIYG